MKEVYNILIIDDEIGDQYLNEQKEFKIKVALEGLIKNRARVNIFTHIGTNDDLSFLLDFVLSEKSWNEFYYKNRKQFEDLDLIIIDTKFPKASNNQGVWGDKLTNRLIELDRANEKKIIGVSNYQIEGKHYWNQSYSDKILMDRICNVLNFNVDRNSSGPLTDISGSTGNASSLQEKTLDDANNLKLKQKTEDSFNNPLQKDPPYLRCKKFVVKLRPFIFETLTFLISLLFIWVFVMVMIYTTSRINNTFKDRESNHHNTAEFKAYDAQIKDAIDLLSTNYITSSDSLQERQLHLSPKDSSITADKKKKALELYTTLRAMHKVHDANPTTRTFELIENLFLLFIPLFVILGFFVYFQKSLSKYLLGGEPGSEVDESTKKSIEVTKKLFLSSIFSFTILKLLDIFVNDISFLPYYTIPINIILKVVILTIVLMIIIWYNYSSRSPDHQ